MSIATYKYDFSGRRVSKTTGGVTTTFAYDGDQIVAEYEQKSGNLKSGDTILNY